MADYLTTWDAVPERRAANGVAKRSLPGGGVDLVRVIVPAGTEAPRHSHAHEQFVQVIEGTGELETEQGRAAFGPGSLFHFPPNTWHAARFGTATVLVETNLKGADA